MERLPSPALAGLASSVWIQQIDDEPLAQRHVPHGGTEVRCVLGQTPRLLGPLTASTHQPVPAGGTVVGIRLRPGAVGAYPEGGNRRDITASALGGRTEAAVFI